jgi:hypothetical protein
MAVTTIARIQHRRGARSDLPASLYEGELGWCIDTRELFIGNGQPFDGNTQILTAQSPSDSIVQHIWQPWSQTYTTAIDRSIGEKMDDVVSIADFGVVGNGIDDVSDKVNAAFASIYQTGASRSVDEQVAAQTVRFPAGTYVIGSTILLYPHINIQGDGIGNTIFVLDTGSTATHMFTTADSMGQTGSSVGSGGAILPQNITIRDLSISTAGQHATAILANRYRNFHIQNVEFVGGYSTGDEAVVGVHSALQLSTTGAGIEIYDCAITGCVIKDFTYAVWAEEPVLQTWICNTWIGHCWKGIALGVVTPSNPGARFTKVFGCVFDATDSTAIQVEGTNSDVISHGNTFRDCGFHDAGHTGTDRKSIRFITNAINCSSISDIFYYSGTSIGAPIEFEASVGHLILDSQQSNLVGTGTVTSVDLDASSLGLTTGGNPVTSTGTLTLTGTLNVASGGTGVTTTPANGKLLIGNGTGYTVANLTAGTGINIANGGGSISISSVPLSTRNIRVVTAAGAVTCTSTDDVIVVNKTVGAATTVNLVATPATGLTVTVKDGKGDSTTNNIYLVPASGTIDGAASVTLNVNYGSVTAIYDGSQWRVI